MRSGWVDSGLVDGKLAQLTVYHLNGAVCKGLAPWNWEQVNQVDIVPGTAGPAAAAMIAVIPVIIGAVLLRALRARR